MTTQVIFKIDKKIKEKAQKKAKGSGLTFSDILQMATYAYVRNDFEPRLVRKEEVLNAKTRRELREMSKDIRAGKNLSPIFDNTKDAIAWLKSSR